MIISHEYKFIFIAIPKSASQYIRKIFRPFLGENDQEVCALFDKIKSKQYPQFKGSGHISAERIKKAVGDEIWNTYFKFAFIRDPYERIVSIYGFSRRKMFDSLKKKGETDKIDNFYKNKPFARMFYTGRIPSFFRQTQSHWIYDKNDNLMIDFVGSMNSLHEDLKFIFNKVGLPEYNEKNKINNSIKIKDYTEYYNKTFNSIINNDFKRDIDNLKKFNFFSKNTIEYLNNPSSNNYWIRKKNIDHNNKSITKNNIDKLISEINILEKKLTTKSNNKKFSVRETLNLTIVNRNHNIFNIQDETIPENIENLNFMNLVNETLENMIPFNYSISKIDYIKLNNNYQITPILRKKYAYKIYKYEIIIPLNFITIRKNKKKEIKKPLFYLTQDNNKYPIELKKGDIFFINNRFGTAISYTKDTSFLLITLLHSN